jgi:hypothetical protein
MTSDYRESKSWCRPGAGLAAVASVAAILLLFGHAAGAQEAQTPQQTTRQHEPGMLESIGRWFEESVGRLNSNMRAARGTFDNIGDTATGAAKDAADAAKDAAKGAADAVARLPSSRVVEGRERCILAANGAPDCRVAADAVCRGKGYASGKSVDIQSAQKCSARIWLSGRKPDAAECEIESFVTRAMCQ